VATLTVSIRVLVKTSCKTEVRFKLWVVREIRKNAPLREGKVPLALPHNQWFRTGLGQLSRHVLGPKTRSLMSPAAVKEHSGSLQLHGQIQGRCIPGVTHLRARHRRIDYEAHKRMTYVPGTYPDLSCSEAFRGCPIRSAYFAEAP
jgi:hypothetical protein